MSTLDLRPAGAPASGTPDWRTRALSVAIALLLLAGVGAAAARTGSTSGASASADDLQLIQSSSRAVEGLDGVEMSMRFEIDGHETTMEGTGSGTDGRFTVSVPGVGEFDLIQIGNRTYLPAHGQAGWAEFVGPAGMEAEAASAVAGQDPLDYLRSISSADEIEVLGQDSVDGVEVTRYRIEVELADALRAAEANFGDLGVSESEIDAMLADASPMRLEIAIDGVGIPRRTLVTYDIQGIDFELESRFRPIEGVAPIGPPPAGEIVSSHPADDVAHLQQLIGSHMAQLATG